MQGSYFHHLFLLCIWLLVKVPQLGCDAVSISGQEDKAAANQCLRKCSPTAAVSRSTAKAFESPETCYKECSKEKAICKEFQKSKTFLPSSHVKIYLVERGPKFYYANISWKISSDDTRNWTQGYLVFYALQINQDHGTYADIDCHRVLGMNTSFTSFNITNENLTYFSELSVMVFSLSQERGNPDDNDWKTIQFLEAATSIVWTDTITQDLSTSSSNTITQDLSTSSSNTITQDLSTSSSNAITDLSTSSSSLPTSAIVAICLTGAFVTVAVVIWWRFVDKKIKEEDVAPLDSGFKFDAFIIYSTTDETWVKKKLLSILEKKHNIKCCIHYRDFLPGVPFVENMAQSVYNSRKTIAVVSKSFLSSNYCNHELNIALHRLVERGDNSVIVIKLDDVEDIDLPIELQFRSYIDFTKATDKKTWEYKLVNSFIGERC